MKWIILLITLVSGFVRGTYCNAQSYHTKSITSEDGLSQSYITSFFEDSRGFIWIGTLYGLNRYDGYEMKSYVPNHLDPWSLHATIITQIEEDAQGLLWLGTDKGIVLFNPHSEKFILLSKLIPDAPTGFVYDILTYHSTNNTNDIWCIGVDKGSNTLYTLRYDATLVQYLSGTRTNPPSLVMHPVPFPEGKSDPVRLFLRTDARSCLLATRDGFYKLDLSKQTIEKTSPPDSPVINGYTRSTLLFPDNDFNDPVPVQERIAILSPPGRKDDDVARYVFRFFDNSVYRLAPGKQLQSADALQQLPVVAALDQPQSFARMIDSNGKIWIGTTGSGIRILEPVLTAFDYLFPDVGFSNPCILPDNQIWAGMYNPDKILHLTTGQISSPPWMKSIPAGESVNAAFYDADSHSIYLGLTRPGQYTRLTRFDLRSNRLHSIQKVTATTDHPLIFFKDSRRNIWLSGAGSELLQYQPASQQLNHWNISYLYPAEARNGQEATRWMAEDGKQRLWIAGDAGLTMVDLRGKKPQFKAYHNSGKRGPIFRNSYIFSVYPDPSNPDLLWLGTMSGGLASFDVRTEKVQYITNLSNQRFDVVTGIIPDKLGNLWLSTDKGIFRYQLATRALVDCSQLGHIPQLSINASAILQTASGNILMGSNNGLVRIQPAKIPFSPNTGRLCLSSITIGRESTAAGIVQNKIRLDNNNQYFLRLAHDDQFISIKFSIPSAVATESIQYRYRMQGFQDEWIYLGNNRSLEFVKLSPGSYTLEIEALESSNTWTDATRLELPINVSPPWYYSMPALLFYALLFAVILWSIIRYQRQRMSLQFKADISQREMERLQSMDNFKNRFFAYIAHEFKTPLTIIMGAGQRLRGQQTADIVAYPDAILREGNNMLNLINELIDVTRLQDKSIQPHYEHRDLISLLNKITASYQPVLEINQIHLSTDYAQPFFPMDLDPLRIQYILNNILSNAVRYTPVGGHIAISVKPSANDKVVIDITDDGQGIPPDKLPHIFDRYYRALDEDNAYHNFGLGLSFVKELAEILYADVSVESQAGQGTTFSLVFPVKAPAVTQVKKIDEKQDDLSSNALLTATSKACTDAPTLLIVDDQPSIQSYLKSILQPHFQLIVARNGQEGLAIATEEIPDLILTDVMMPIMDGIEMTEKLKSHPLTSHIPVVMLSAKNEIQDRLKGQEQGANLYIGKPFHERELVMALFNLYKLQQQWKTRYAEVIRGTAELQKAEAMPPSFSPDSIAHNDMFIKKILDLFETNYTSENFDAVELAAALNISKSQLYRKVSNISGEGIMGMLRNYRLHKAVELLSKHPQMTTKEVAYKVGFKEYSHFSSSFKKLFQVSPSEWRKLKP